MKKFNLESYSVEVDNEEQSKQLQEMAFEQGFEWRYGGKVVLHVNTKFLIFREGEITFDFYHDEDLKQKHFNEILLKEEAKERGYTADNFECLKGFKEHCTESIEDWTYYKCSDTLYANLVGKGGKIVYEKGVLAKMKSKTLEQQLAEAEAEVKRLKEEINKPKIGDICLFKTNTYEFLATYTEEISSMFVKKLTREEFVMLYDFKECIPEKWCVKITIENKETLKSWAEKQPNYKKYQFIGYLVNHIDDNSYLHYGNAPEQGYTEITFEEFKKYFIE